MENEAKVHVWILCAAAFLGVMGDFLLKDGLGGIGLAAWLLLTLGGVVLVSRVMRQGFVGIQTRAFTCVAIVFSATLLWRDSLFLRWLGAGAVFVSVALGSKCVEGFNARLAGIMEYVSASGRMLELLISRGFVRIVKRVYEARVCVCDKESLRVSLAVGRGLLMAAPLLLVFGGLLVSADMVFKSKLGEVFDFDLETVIRHGAIALACAWLAGGLIKGLLLGFEEGERMTRDYDGLRIGSIEVAVAMAMLNLLFLAFVLVQFRYFFGGAERVAQVEGLTYSAYARKGFFELCAVAGLVLPLQLMLDWFTRFADRPGKLAFRLLALMQTAMVFVMMASALQRMRLYVAEYGLTQLRFYSAAFMVWLGVLFVLLAATVLLGKRQHFAHAALVTGLVAILTLHAVNPDAWIMRANLARAERTGKFDANYASMLSADSLSTLVAGLDKLDEEKRKLTLEKLRLHAGRLLESGWRNWNIGRNSSVRALEAVGGQLNTPRRPSAPAE